MTSKDKPQLSLHLDRDFFRAALVYTSEARGFSPLLIEKDYYCSVLLSYLFSDEPLLVFKGGTCLSKVHVGFNRLSEDLDFMISIHRDASRTQRRELIDPVKQHMMRLSESVPGFFLKEELKGHNNSTQYLAVVNYFSTMAQTSGAIKVEIALREKLLATPMVAQARTLLQDPFSRKDAVNPFSVRAMSVKEAYAEKLRAALTRRNPAIRDFYDIDYAVKNSKLDPKDKELLNFVSKKLSIPGNALVDVSEARKVALARQLYAQLRPVLLEKTFLDFDLDRAFILVSRFAEGIGQEGIHILSAAKQAAKHRDLFLCWGFLREET